MCIEKNKRSDWLRSLKTSVWLTDFAQPHQRAAVNSQFKRSKVQERSSLQIGSSGTKRDQHSNLTTSKLGTKIKPVPAVAFH